MLPGRNNAEDVRVVNPGGDNAEDGVPVVNPGGNNAKDGVPVVNLIVPGGDNAGGGVDNPGDIVDRDSVRNKARWSGETKGGEKPNKPQKNPQLVVRLTCVVLMFYLLCFAVSRWTKSAVYS